MRVDPNFIQNLATSLDQAQAQQQQLSSQLSSGARLSSLSQDPAASGQNVLLLNQIQQDDSFTQSSTLITGQLQVADSALGSVVSQLTQAISLATSANNGTMPARSPAFSARLQLWPTPAIKASTSSRAARPRPRPSALQMPPHPPSQPTAATRTSTICRCPMDKRFS